MGVCILVSLGKHVGSVNWRVIGRHLYQQICTNMGEIFIKHIMAV